MKKKLILAAKIIGIIVAVLIAAIIGLSFALNSKSVQNKLMRHATELLSEKLGVPVVIDSVSIDVVKQDIRLYGLDLEDLQQRKMLRMEMLAISPNLKALLNNEVKVKHVHVKGLHAQLVKESADSAANFQFIIDAFSKKKNTDSIVTDTIKKESSKKLSFDLTSVTFEDISLSYAMPKQDLLVALDKLKLDKSITGKYKGRIDSLKMKTDNHKPRKNEGKPHRGAFDAGHLDVAINMKLSVDHFAKDTIHGMITEMDASDSGSGLTINSMTCAVGTDMKRLHITDMKIVMPNTSLAFNEGFLTLPNKKQERTLNYSTSPIDGHTILTDIAKAFSPTLSKFTTPLDFKVTLSGDADGMAFNDINVKTPDNRLGITAKGGITNLKTKERMAIRFQVSKMHARKGIKEQIIDHFPVKKLMMKQLKALGDITFSGRVGILWKKEEFQGVLNTAVGRLNFYFALDEANKYVYGNASSKAVDIGHAFDVPDLGTIAASAKFRVDISKPRTAKMRRLKGGKLPIGTVTAEVDEANYKKLKVRNIEADIVSDGAVATGTIKQKNKRIDLMCDFTFTSTDSLQKMKVKPRLKFHGLSDEDRKEKEERKAQEQKERELRKAQEQKEKQERKAQKKTEREAKKELKAQEKAARKAKKAAEKAARNAGE